MEHQTNPSSSSASLTPISTLTAPNSNHDDEYEYVDATADESSTAWHCAWSSDGKLLASCHGAPDTRIHIWTNKRRCSSRHDSEEEEEERWELAATLNGVHERTIRTLEFNPFVNASSENYMIASASFDGTIAIWEHIPSINNNDTNTDMQQWDCTAQLEGHESEVKGIAWNATGTLLASCGRDKSVWLWEYTHSSSSTTTIESENEFDCIAVLHGHEGDVKCVTFAPSNDQFGDGEDVLISGSYDDSIRLWAEDGGEWYCACVLNKDGAHGGSVWSVAAAPGGVRLVSASADRSLCVWRCYLKDDDDDDNPNNHNNNNGDGSYKCVGQLKDAHLREIYSVHCAPSRAGHGRIASGGADDAIHIYREVMGGTSHAPKFALDVGRRSAHVGDVNCVRWHPRDGSLLASAGDDGAVKLWRYNCSQK